MSWANIDRNSFNNINNRWQNQIGGVQNWQTRYPNRVNYWNGWGNGVRTNLGYQYNNCFNNNWWYDHPHQWSGWHYGYQFNNHNSNYWWTIPTFSALNNWFTWQAPTQVWSEPAYYDYGQGGNVVYEDNSVYIDNQPVATVQEFAESAAELATVAPPTDEDEAAEAEWMPLGTFAVAAGEEDVDPARVVQLAVNKQGIVSGTLYNSQTEQTDSVQGQVDKETQRVAMRIGESDQVVVETGLYNLTQDNAPLLVHFGSEEVENWLLVRLENSDQSSNTKDP